MLQSRHFHPGLPGARQAIGLLLLVVSLFPAGRPARAAALAQAGATLTLLPAAARPGAQVQAAAAGLTADETYGLSADCVNGGQTETFTAPPGGRYTLLMTVALDVTAPGSCTFHLVNRSGITPGEVAHADLALLAPITLSLDPSAGPPGTVVDFTARNLTPGSLRLDYAGVPVLGPVPVAGPFYPGYTPVVTVTGSFTVPADRPSPLGALAAVSAVNLVGGAVVARDAASFQSEQPPPQPAYQLTDLAVQTTTLTAGALFTITGQIKPAPPGPFQVVPLFGQGRQVFPLNSAFTLLDSSGRFRLTAALPGLASGDPLDVYDQGIYSLVGLGAAQSTPVKVLPIKNIPPEAFLIVDVTAGDTQEPVPDVLVDVLPAPDLELYDTSETEVQNQLRYWARLHGVGGEALAEIGPLCDSDIYGKTNLQGQYELLLTDPWGPLINPDPLLDFTQPQTILSAAGELLTPPEPAPGPPAPARQRAPQAPPPGPQEPQPIPYVVVIDGRNADYAELVKNKPMPSLRYVAFKQSTRQFVDADGLPLPGNTLQVTLPPVPDKYKTVTILPTRSGPPLYGFKPAVSLPNTTINNLPPGNQTFSFALPTYTADHKVAGVKMTGPHGEVVVAARSDSDACKTSENVVYSAVFTLDLTQYDPGAYQVTIEVTRQDGGKIIQAVPLDVSPLPAWFIDPTLRARQVNGYELSAQRLRTDLDRVDASTTAEMTPEIGEQLNNTGAAVTLRAYLDQGGLAAVPAIKGGLEGVYTNVPRQQTFANQSGSSFTLYRDTATQTTLLSCPPEIASHCLPFSYGPQSLFGDDKPSFAVSAPVFAIPVIVTIGVGMEMSFDASLGVDGYMDILNPTHMQLNVTPSVDVYVKIGVNASVLLGFLAQGQANNNLNIGLALPLTIQDAQSITADVCFRTRDYLDYWAGLICVPCTHYCLWSDSGQYQIFNYSTPDSPQCQKYPDVSRLQTVLAAPPGGAPEAPPPGWPVTGNPALATDGGEQIMGLWNNGANSFLATLYDGLNWSTGVSLTTGSGPLDPAVAFYDYRKAVAVWAESTLPMTATGVTVSQAQNSYHLAYALWDTDHWSAPMALTAPTTGDAKPALAACPAWDRQCPSGGAVTAVWVHDRVGDMQQRRFSLYTAAFTGGAWSAASQVDPSTSFDGADTQPQVAYLVQYMATTGKTAFIAWVRDEDRDLSTVADRRIATRWLGFCGLVLCKVSVPNSLPDSIMELSLAGGADNLPRLAFTRAENGAQALDIRHTLYNAWLDCSGMFCLWVSRKLADPYGRALYAERPTLTVDRDGRATIVFRGLGFAASPGQHAVRRQDGDSLGMTLRTGDLVQAEVLNTAAGSRAALTFLTNDAAVNWMPIALYSPKLDRIVAAAMRGEAPTLTAGQRAALQPHPERLPSLSALLAAYTPVVIAQVPRLPDFALDSLQLPAAIPLPTQTLTLAVTLRNNALSWTGSVTQPLTLAATWDGPYGLGQAAGLAAFTALDAGELHTVTLELSRPVDLDFVHTLYVTANPTQTVAELSSANNTLSGALGGLPAPQEVTAVTRRGRRSVVLTWTPPADSRIAGYRIYRAGAEGPFEAVGSTFTHGFVDLTAGPDRYYRYAVTAYTARGIESPPGGPVKVDTAAWKVYAPLVVRGR